MTPDLVTSVITSIPNLAIAVWCIWNYQRTIDKLIDQENKLLDQLLVRVSADDRDAERPTSMQADKK